MGTQVVTTSDRVAKAQNLVGRLERMPFSGWHVNLRLVVGMATLFNALDATAIAYVIPVLVPKWHTPPQMIGFLLATGFIGQIIGTVVFGSLADRVGRRVSLIASIGLFSVMSFACAGAWSYVSLFTFRFIQGIGLGGEMPIAASYITEFGRAKGRGRFVLLYATLYSVGLLVTSILGYFIVPRWGWQWMFIIGGLPIILAIAFPWLMPESPRFLIAKGELDEAEKVVSMIEDRCKEEGKELPPIIEKLYVAEKKASWGELFQGIYAKRTLTLWPIFFICYFAVQSITTWVPSIFARVFHLPLELALRYSLIMSALQIASNICCALLIDKVGRRNWLILAFTGGGIAWIILFLTGVKTAETLLIIGTIGMMFISTLTTTVYLYAPELYPTRMRGVGVSLAGAWTRIGSALGPIVLGFMVGSVNMKWVAFLIGAILLVGAVIALVLAQETKDKALEVLSP